MSLLYASSCNSISDRSVIFSQEEVDVVFPCTAAERGFCSGVQEGALAGSDVGMDGASQEL